MKINKPVGSQMVNPYHKQQSISAKVEQSTSSNKKDQLQISSEAKALLETQSNRDVARQEKINQLKSQIQNGEYKVDSEQVAEKVVKFWFAN